MSDETTAEMLAEIDRDLADIEKAVSALQQQAAQANYPQQVETTTDRLAEIEEQSEPQPVQVREGRWRTRNGEIRHVTPTPAHYREADRHSWHDAHYYETWYPSGRYSLTGDHPLDLVEYLGPIQPEPEQTITPDDVAAEALAGVFDQGKAEQQITELQAQVNFLKGRELTLGTRLQDEKTVSTKRLQQIQELRSEVSHVQGLLGEEKLQNVRLETLVADLRAVNAGQEKAINGAVRDKADLQHRLDVVSSEWAQQAETIRGLQTQLEAVKAELVQQCETSRRLQIELDAREQVPQAVSDRFEEGWDKGTAQAVETIAEWTEVFRTCGSQGLSYHVMQNLPHIMRSLTGLADED